VKGSQGKTKRVTLFAAPALMLLIAAVIAGPVPQDPAYHDFADTRILLAVPNFWNVVSNLLFLLVGASGIALVATSGPAITGALRPAWLAFFAGVGLTAFGSAYYHWSPDNASLAWDRLAMTIAFMGLCAIMIGEYLDVRAARRLLLLLLAVGAGSVGYWLYTESLGAGDLRPYAVVQFLPMALLPLLMALRRGRSDLAPYLAWMIGCYVLAKLAEHYDMGLLTATGLSGHSIKHVVAAVGTAGPLAGLARRRQRQTPQSPG
jgi:hypothetical protein